MTVSRGLRHIDVMGGGVVADSSTMSSLLMLLLLVLLVVAAVVAVDVEIGIGVHVGGKKLFLQ